MTRFNDILNGIKNTVNAEQKDSDKKILKSKTYSEFNMGDKVVNINPSCMHYGSKGKVCGFEKLPNEMGNVVAYKTTNSGKNWTIGQILKKTANQLLYDYDEYEAPLSSLPLEDDYRD